jgi:hypothetical protein
MKGSSPISEELIQKLRKVCTGREITEDQIEQVHEEKKLPTTSKGLIPNLTTTNQLVEHVVSQLYRIASRSGPINLKTSHVNTWRNQLNRFRFKLGDNDRIKKVIDWYAENYMNDFVPKAFSANTFIDKFVQIESAMYRMTGKWKKVKETKIVFKSSKRDKTKQRSVVKEKEFWIHEKDSNDN